MRTGSHLKIQPMGENVLGVKLDGNPQKPEPIHFRVTFPGGDVDIVRTTDGGDYWIHVRVNHEEHVSFDPSSDRPARIADARLDITDKHASDTNAGDFANPNLYHLAVRIAPATEGK